MKKVYCYIEVSDECGSLDEAWKSWLSQTHSRMKAGLEPQIELYQMEEAVGKSPECGLPATHPSGLCRDCHQGKLEAVEAEG